MYGPIWGLYHALCRIMCEMSEAVGTRYCKTSWFLGHRRILTFVMEFPAFQCSRRSWNSSFISLLRIDVTMLVVYASPLPQVSYRLIKELCKSTNLALTAVIASFTSPSALRHVHDDPFSLSWNCVVWLQRDIRRDRIIHFGVHSRRR